MVGYVLRHCAGKGYSGGFAVGLSGASRGWLGLLPRSSPAPGRQKEPASRARALLAVAGQAATPQSVGGKPPQLTGLRFVARAPLNCVEADALQFWLFRSNAVKIKPSQ
jgi:hypothetical protein